MRATRIPSIALCGTMLLFLVSRAIWAQVETNEVTGVLTYDRFDVDLAMSGILTQAVPDVGAQVYFMNASSACSTWQQDSGGVKQEDDDIVLKRFRQVDDLMDLLEIISRVNRGTASSDSRAKSSSDSSKGGYDSWANSARTILTRLASDQGAKRATADATGRYIAKLKAGTYVAVFISRHVRHPNEAEESGIISLECFEVTEGQSVDLSHSFGLPRSP